MNDERTDERARADARGGMLGFWGKAQAPGGSAATSHPIAYHCLDVAAMVAAILRTRPLAVERISRLLGLTATDATTLMVFLAALHDIGKFASVFQAKSPQHWPNALADVDAGSVLPSHHTADGYALWHEALRDQFADRVWYGAARTLDVLAPSVFGHHGRPVKERDAKRSTKSIFAPAGRDAAITFADTVSALLVASPIGAAVPTEERARIASWWVAGLMTVADWIGSNDRWFAYTAPDLHDLDLSAYWAHAQRCAERAVSEAGLAAPRISEAKTFTGLTGIVRPSPAQCWATDTQLPNGPLLVILEDVTGAGKTEAAQMLVHRLMVDGRAAGAYWAMPTQATANAMYERQADTVNALFDVTLGGARPSVALAHGQTRLHDGFRATVLRADDERLDAGTSREPGFPASAACAAFLADDRRAALLADVGAGTVDQALLGALPSRFNTVRLFGMADKVLVFDEAHAYDAYMGVEVQQLLRFQAALGGSAIVLSATLSREQRETFANAWREGLEDGKRRVALFADLPPLVQSMDYPLATIVSRNGVDEERVEAAEWSRRRVPVRLVHEVGDALTHVVESARRGAAVAWIRNTVEDCLTAAAEVRAQGLKPIVFHARFAQGDRQARERQVLELFGKGGSADGRRGAVLIASQVVEQSLDLDFDVLVTDLAPVDLLIQRAGRLWRHRELRTDQRPRDVVCELVVLSPPPVVEPAKDWLTAVLPKTARVYRHAGVLWRTARALAEAGAIETPTGLRAMIEAVYAGDDPLPEALLGASQLAEGEELGNASAATHATLELTDGYHGDLKGWVDDVKPMTRVGDQQTTVRLARVLADGQLAPWATADGPTWKAWALSEVRLRASRVPWGSTVDVRYAAAIEVARAQWGRFEQEVVALPLLENAAAPGTWDGAIMRSDGRVTHVRYNVSDGLAYGTDAR